ncbi:uncharacterized protein A4U43_C02F4190 [Asparagus officinalis]|uniref:Bifunctional inhibitor/plant lipid transfer protein/seed storage helical domain-containing protein n=1 Tax=Asparagus officinalis TaxID=4686 RepID=A0A5P1FIH3_ASPOF|nr:uncharacterized protein A4U43_C02F4190 [Asparagus officinalis]
MAGSSAPLLAVIIVLVSVACQHSEGAISCFEADVTPCVNYSCGSGSGPVPHSCCSGIKKLNSTATSTADRRMNGGGARGDAGGSPAACSGGFGSGVGFGGEESGEERYEEEGGAGVGIL